MRKRTIWADKAQRDPLFGGLGVEARHAYWVLQCYADDTGRILWNPMYISTCLSFPGVSVEEVTGMMASLTAAGQTEIYEVEGATYAAFRHWGKEQSVDRPGAPRYPAPPSEIEAAKTAIVAPVKPRADKTPKTTKESKDLLGTPPSKPKAKRKATARKDKERAETEAALQEIYEFYCRVFGKTKSYVFSEARRAAVRKQLRAGYDVKACKRAIVGNLHSAWHQGANDRQTAYNDLVFIFKDASRVDDFIERFKRAKKARDSGAPIPGSQVDESDHQSGEDILSDVFGGEGEE